MTRRTIFYLLRGLTLYSILNYSAVTEYDM